MAKEVEQESKAATVPESKGEGTTGAKAEKKSPSSEKGEKATERRITYTGDRPVICAGITWLPGEPKKVSSEVADIVLTNEAFKEVG